MTRFGRRLAVVAALLGAGAGLVGAPALAAQEHAGQAEHAAQREEAAKVASGQIDIVHHLANSHEVELPFGIVWHLPQGWNIPLGTAADGTPRVLDISPTKHLVFMLFAAALVALTFILSAGAISRAQAAGRPPKGIAGAMEATALYIRQEVILPNVGPHGEGFAPYLLTLFFFILAMNLLGLLPWGAAATGNIAVTAALAVIAFVVIEVTGMRTLGFKGYMGLEYESADDPATVVPRYLKQLKELAVKYSA